MRCQNCGKFVSYGEPETNVDHEDINDSIVSVTTRVVLPCAECGEELKEADLEFEFDLDELHECLADEELDSAKDPYELLDVEAIEESKRITVSKTGKQIAYSNQKQYYGAKVIASVKCNRCNESFTVSDTLYKQASYFQELY